jgi:hypothetical protein
MGLDGRSWQPHENRLYFDMILYNKASADLRASHLQVKWKRSKGPLEWDRNRATGANERQRVLE